MDDWLQEFKRRRDTMAQEIFKKLCYNDAKAICNHQENKENKINSASLTNDHHLHIFNGHHEGPLEAIIWPLCNKAKDLQELVENWVHSFH